MIQMLVIFDGFHSRCCGKRISGPFVYYIKRCALLMNLLSFLKNRYVPGTYLYENTLSLESDWKLENKLKKKMHFLKMQIHEEEY